MNIVIERINERIIHLNFRTQYDLTSTFVRLQEFYESPYEEIKGKYFTLETFMDKYAKEFGNYSYNTDWNGFNVPGNVVEEFYKLFGWNMRSKEAKLKNILQEDINSIYKFYVIGTHGIDDITLSHEIAHALFYLNENYKTEMLNCINNNIYQNEFNKFKKQLLKMGYCDEVLNDEVQAYLSTGLNNELKNKGFEKSQKEFRKIFEKYYENFK